MDLGLQGRVAIVTGGSEGGDAASFQVGGTGELRDEDWLYHLNVKLLAYVRFVRLASPGMRSRGWGPNLIHPGATRTHRHEINVNRRFEREGISLDQAEHETIANIPIKRMIEPADCAELIAFLASGRASAIVGQAISVDGGSARGVFY